MPIILSILGNRFTWLFILIGLVIAAFGVEQARISHLKSVVAESHRQLDIAKAELKQSADLVARWKSAYDKSQELSAEQEAKVAQLEAEVRRRMQAARAALAEADKQRVAAEGLAKQLTTMEVSKNECQAFRQLVDAARVGGLR